MDWTNSVIGFILTLLRRFSHFSADINICLFFYIIEVFMKTPVIQMGETWNRKFINEDAAAAEDDFLDFQELDPVKNW